VLDLVGEVGGNGVKRDALRVVDIVDGSGQVGGNALLLTIFGLADKCGPVLASLVVDDVVDDTSVVAKEGIE